MVFKNFLTSEDDRNRKNHQLYERLIQLAVGPEVRVLVVHHITFELGEAEPNEIPSADCLMMDHQFMGAAFGNRMYQVMSQLSVVPVPRRDLVLEEFVFEEEKRRAEAVEASQERARDPAGG